MRRHRLVAFFLLTLAIVKDGQLLGYHCLLPKELAPLPGGRDPEGAPGLRRRAVTGVDPQKSQPPT